MTSSVPATRHLRPALSRGGRRRAREEREAGFSLIEIMIAMAIAGLLVGGAVLGFGAAQRANIRSSSAQIAGAARFAYARALRRHVTTRLAFDFERNQFTVEERDGQFLLRDPTNEARRSLLDEPTDEELAEGGSDPWARAEARLSDAIAPGRDTSFADISEEMPENLREELDGIMFLQLITPHELDPRQDGKGYIYFFPGGRAENAVIQLRDEGGEVYSVALHPLTGAPRIVAGEYEPPEIEDEGEARDNG